MNITASLEKSVDDFVVRCSAMTLIHDFAKDTVHGSVEKLSTKKAPSAYS